MRITFDPITVVTRETGKCRTAVYNDISNGLFTPGVAVGLRSRRWPRHETEAINAARLAGRTEDEIRALVKKLMKDRLVADRNI